MTREGGKKEGSNKDGGHLAIVSPDLANLGCDGRNYMQIKGRNLPWQEMLSNSEEEEAIFFVTINRWDMGRKKAFRKTLLEFEWQAGFFLSKFRECLNRTNISGDFDYIPSMSEQYWEASVMV